MTEKKKTVKKAKKKPTAKKVTKKSTAKKTTKKVSKKRKSAAESSDPGIIIVDDDLSIDRESEMEESRAYLEEARSQEASSD